MKQFGTHSVKNDVLKDSNFSSSVGELDVKGGRTEEIGIDVACNGSVTEPSVFPGLPTRKARMSLGSKADSRDEVTPAP
jgi:hypothetical protein